MMKAFTRRTIRFIRAPSDSEDSVPAETHVVDGPLDRQAIFHIVRDQLVDILEIDPSSISEGQSFKDDLNADSLALVELVDALEEELSERTVGFRIEDEDLADLKTVRDAVDFVYAHVMAHGSGR
jgi:acyl carrier protein